MNSSDRFSYPLGTGIVALVVLGFFLWLGHSDVVTGVSGGDGANIVLGMALASGEGFRYLPVADAPAPAAVGFPPLYPILMSLVWRLWPTFPANLTLVHLLSSGALAAAAWLLVAHGTRLEMSRWAVYVAALLGFASVPVSRIAVVPSAEPVLFALATAAVWFGDRPGKRESSAYLAGLFAGLAALTVQWGAVMIGAVALGFAARKAWRSSGISIAVGLAVLLLGRLVWWGTLIGSASWDVGISGLAVVSGFQSAESVSTLLFPAIPRWSILGATAVVVVLAVWGAASVVRQAPTLVSAAVLVALGLLFGSSATKWIAIPWMFLLAAAGAVRLWKTNRRVRITSAAIGSVVAVVYLVGAGSTITTREFLQESLELSEEYDLITSSIAGETVDSAVIAAQHDALVFLYSRRRTVRYDEATGNAEGGGRLRSLCEGGATHVLSHTRWPETGAALRRSAAALFRLTDGAALYRLDCAAGIEDPN